MSKSQNKASTRDDRFVLVPHESRIEGGYQPRAGGAVDPASLKPPRMTSAIVPPKPAGSKDSKR